METPTQPDNRQVTIEVPSLGTAIRNRKLLPGSFGLVIVFFFFTFCNFKCGNQTVASVSGYELITGTKVGGSRPSDRESRKLDPNPWAIVALASAAVGLGIYLVKSKYEEYVGIGVGVLGAASLLVLRYMMLKDVRGAQGMVDVSFRFGYWAALFCLTAGAVLSFLRLRFRRADAKPVAEIPPPPAPRPDGWKEKLEEKQTGEQ